MHLNTAVRLIGADSASRQQLGDWAARQSAPSKAASEPPHPMGSGDARRGAVLFRDKL